MRKQTMNAPAWRTKPQVVRREDASKAEERRALLEQRRAAAYARARGNV